MIIWNPWHGCHKVSEGCEHCYMYFLDSKRGLDTSHVFRTENFAAAGITYTDEEMRDINQRLAQITLSGHRYNADNQKNMYSRY